VRLGETESTIWPIVPTPGDRWCGTVSGMRMTGETEVLGENLPQCHFVHHKSHMTWPGTPRWEVGDWPPKLWQGPVLDTVMQHKHRIYLQMYLQGCRIPCKYGKGNWNVTTWQQP
jgi:hypothetical protein